jgi:hypothetical protein
MTDAIEALATPGLTPHERIDRFEAAIIDTPKPEAEFINYFAPGLYARGMKMKAFVEVDGELRQACLTGAEHTEACLTVVIYGRLIVYNERGEAREVKGGDVFVSPAGTRRAGLILEDCFFLTVHANPDNNADPEELFARLAHPPRNPLLAHRNLKVITGGTAS